ncbi:MAG: hypothetical protein PHQ28_15580 [Mycobacterium sp.]|nr:hypothetical protein [Mycobacterium sp.]
MSAMEAPGYAMQWRRNAERRGVPMQVVDDIARRHGIDAERFGLLEAMTEIRDPLGKSFFLIPPRCGGRDAREEVLLTYILNAGTDYGRQPADFSAPPYCATEVERIIDRQNRNHWSYRRDVGFVQRNGGHLVTTPNGMLMGAGGNWIQRQFSRRGGTTWGDIFMVNLGRTTDPAERLRRIVASGRLWHTDRGGTPRDGGLGLDRVLHHEERHCRQWAAKGYAGMLRDYGRELLREWILGETNRLEADAGLSNGGYRP